MEKNSIEEYIDELKGISGQGKDLDLYSLKKELIDLDESSNVFENFEEETGIIDKDALNQMQDLSLLIKIKNLASEIKNKKEINDKLHSLHFNLNLLKNNLATDSTKSIKNSLHAFLHDDKTKIDGIINELNDFKAKLEEIKMHHLNLFSKSLDGKLETENKYSKHIEQLHSIHKKQKDAMVSTVKLFLKTAKRHVKKSAKI